ncbi:MAG: DegT/DnrJ/EryC1/StrS family aminotransferase [Prevotella sp.]|nr:DegT/DnrJ/EryC1/StrS family aminotransferase [Prevotella sp.]
MIEYLPLGKINALHGAEIREAIDRVVDSGWYLLGDAVRTFESEYAQFIGTKHCVGVANGLDALTLILRACIEMGKLSLGDEVIVPANTYVATILSITENNLVPVLVEPSIETLQMDDQLIERSITPRTRAVMMVHLYGCCAYSERVGELCRKYGLLLFEDNAQAHGCTFGNRRTGSLGYAAAHSFYPGKNLGALGDAGAVTTDDQELASMVRTLGNYGSSKKYVFDVKGRNSRLDELQAAVLSVKLRHLDADNALRQRIADFYNRELAVPSPLGSGVYHVYPILRKRRDELQQYLLDNGVRTMIHYPIPPHKQHCYKEWNSMSLPVTERIHREELSLPCHQAMTIEEASRVVELVNGMND